MARVPVSPLAPCPDCSDLFAALPIELLLDWKQNADEVIVKLRVGTGPVRLEEVDAAFTDTDCVLRLPGVFMYLENRITFEFSDTPTPAYFCHFFPRWSAVGWCLLC